MVKIRLKRVGKRNAPSYRLVVADSRSPRDGRFIEIVGNYNPIGREKKVNLERVDYWLSVGAQPTKTVASLIKKVREGTPDKPSLKSIIREAKAKEVAKEKAKKLPKEKETKTEPPKIAEIEAKEDAKAELKEHATKETKEKETKTEPPKIAEIEAKEDAKAELKKHATKEKTPEVSAKKESN